VQNKDYSQKKQRSFINKRIKYAKDEYDKFNPKDILSLDVETSNNKIVLEGEIDSCYQYNNKPKLKI